MKTSKQGIQWVLNIPAMIAFVLLMIPGFSFGSDLKGHASQNGGAATSPIKKDHQLDKGHRYIEGVVEEVNENTIRVDAGEAGELSPRYLNLSNSKGKEDLKVGDMLQIEVNAQNKVVKYQKIQGSKEKN